MLVINVKFTKNSNSKKSKNPKKFNIKSKKFLFI